jgi:hypothetical protein
MGSGTREDEGRQGNFASKNENPRSARLPLVMHWLIVEFLVDFVSAVMLKTFAEHVWRVYEVNMCILETHVSASYKCLYGFGHYAFTILSYESVLCPSHH